MQYATVAELADIFEVAKSTVTVWIKKGDDFPDPAGYIDNGSRILRAYSVEEVAEWLIERELGVISNQRAIQDNAQTVINEREKKIGSYRTAGQLAKKKNTGRKLIQA